MANPLKGEADLTIGPKEVYRLVIDINALAEAEDATGMDIDQLLTGLQRGRSLKVLRALLWAGLQEHHACHLARAGEIMSSAPTGSVHDAVSRAVVGAFPQSEGGGADKGNAAAA